MSCVTAPHPINGLQQRQQSKSGSSEAPGEAPSKAPSDAPSEAPSETHFIPRMAIAMSNRVIENN